MQSPVILRPAYLALTAGMLMSSAGAQTPLPNMPPPPNASQQLKLPQLQGISVAPLSVTAGATARGTVALSGRALAVTTVGLRLSGAPTQEGGVLVSEGVVYIPSAVVVPAGSDRASFDVVTAASGTWAGTKKFSVTAILGSQSVSTSFTVTR